jgi:hypothetical protein
MTAPTDHTDLERRLGDALRTEATAVEPDGDTLSPIRTRVRTARRRRRAIAAGGLAAAVVAAVAIAVPRLGGGDDDTRISDQPTVTTPRPTPDDERTPTTGSTDPSPPAGVLDQALWPYAGDQVFDDPVAAARSFVEEFLDIDDPPLSEFHESEPRAGEVDVYARGEDGGTLDRVAGTVVLRQLDGEHWYVTAAGSADLQIDTPEPLTEIASPVTLTGRARGFEGTVIVRVLQFDGRTVEDVGGPVAGIAGTDTSAPFSVEVPFESDLPRGAVVATTEVGTGRGIPSFAALPVRLAGGEDPAADPPADRAGTFDRPPLWPFSTQADVDDWQDAHRDGGHQPWHLDAEQTALSFTNGFLGFTGIDRVVGSDVRDGEAWIQVGYLPEAGGRETVAADVHLFRWGSGPDAPWEVVGTRDTTLTLDTPRYGATAGSPLTVGGLISGVDESLRIEVRQPSSEAPLGESCCVPAGGERQRWSTSVSYAGATDAALTVVVSTGGHVQDVERFAITAVRPR